MSVSRLYTGGGCTWIETNYALSRADSPTHHQSAWLPPNGLLGSAGAERIVAYSEKADVQ
jgi:hypothetical protein